MSIELIAIQLGDALKNQKSLNEINRVATAVFQFSCQEFSNNSITSERARLTYNWIMSLGHHACSPEKRQQLLITFVKSLTSGETDYQNYLLGILSECGLYNSLSNENALERFDSHQFHPAITEHCRDLYGEGNYFHAVFEATKVYNNLVKAKAQSTDDGASLMHRA